MSYDVERYWWYRNKCDAIESLTDELITKLPADAVQKVTGLIREFYQLREQPDFNSPEYQELWGKPFHENAA